MNSNTRKLWIIGIAAAVLCVALVAVVILLQDRSVENVNRLNDNLDAGGVQLNLGEKQIVELLGGEGEYVEGFGGYLRTYEEKGIRIGFSGDKDNDFYGKASSVAYWKSPYSIYGIQIGDELQASIQKIQSQGYKHLTEEMYRNGEYVIALHGTSKVELVQIWFDDKDLRDRNY